MKLLYKIIAYISLFAFLLNISACTTTEQFSDTPEKIFSGKSEIDLKGDYTLDSISLRSKRTIPLKGYMANYIERQKEKYLVYYNPKVKLIDSALMEEKNSKVLLYKKLVADTLNFNAIDSMYFSGKKTDVSYVVLGLVIGAPVLLFFGGWIWASMNRIE